MNIEKVGNIDLAKKGSEVASWINPTATYSDAIYRIKRECNIT